MRKISAVEPGPSEALVEAPSQEREFDPCGEAGRDGESDDTPSLRDSEYRRQRYRAESCIVEPAHRSREHARGRAGEHGPYVNGVAMSKLARLKKHRGDDVADKEKCRR